MSVAKMPTIRNYDEALDMLNGRTYKKIGHNTELVNGNDGSIGIRYHNTVIVRYHANGTLTLNTGGYNTVTTFGRMGQITRHFGYWVGRHKWESYIQPMNRNAERITGWQIISILPDGTLNVRK